MGAWTFASGQVLLDYFRNFGMFGINFFYPIRSRVILIFHVFLIIVSPRKFVCFYYFEIKDGEIIALFCWPAPQWPATEHYHEILAIIATRKINLSMP